MEAKVEVMMKGEKVMDVGRFAFPTNYTRMFVSISPEVDRTNTEDLEERGYTFRTIDLDAMLKVVEAADRLIVNMEKTGGCANFVEDCNNLRSALRQLDEGREEGNSGQ